jgi:hypothetical protein
VPALESLLETFRTAPSGPDAGAALDARVRALEQLEAQAAGLVRGSDITLEHYAPALASLPEAAGLPVPGGGNGAIAFKPSSGSWCWSGEACGHTQLAVHCICISMVAQLVPDSAVGTG